MDSMLLLFGGLALATILAKPVLATQRALRDKRKLDNLLRAWIARVRLPEDVRPLDPNQYFTRRSALPEHYDEIHRGRLVLKQYFENFGRELQATLASGGNGAIDPMSPVEGLVSAFVVDGIPIVRCAMLAHFLRPDWVLPQSVTIDNALRHLSLRAAWQPDYENAAILALLLLECSGSAQPEERDRLAHILEQERMHPTTLSLWLELAAHPVKRGKTPQASVA